MVVQIEEEDAPAKNKIFFYLFTAMADPEGLILRREP